VTHSEMTHLLPSPQTLPYSRCPGEMTLSALSRELAEWRDRDGKLLRRTELWHCERCRFTIVVEVEGLGSRRIRNGYPGPTMPSPKVALLD
jgi:hypothetical protein